MYSYLLVYSLTEILLLLLLLLSSLSLFYYYDCFTVVAVVFFIDVVVSPWWFSTVKSLLIATLLPFSEQRHLCSQDDGHLGFVAAVPLITSKFLTATRMSLR